MSLQAGASGILMLAIITVYVMATAGGVAIVLMKPVSEHAARSCTFCDGHFPFGSHLRGVIETKQIPWIRCKVRIAGIIMKLRMGDYCFIRPTYLDSPEICSMIDLMI